MLPSELKHKYPRVRAYDEEDQGQRRYHGSHVRSRKLKGGGSSSARFSPPRGMNKMSPSGKDLTGWCKS